MDAVDEGPLPQSAKSLSHTREFAEVSEMARMQRLLRAVQELSLAASLDEIQRIVRSAARELTGADGATFVLREDDECYYADEDAIAPLWKGSRFPLETCISGWAMLNRASAVIPDIYRDPRIPHDAYRPTFVKSLVMVPIRTLDPIGAIGNYWARERQPTPKEVELLQALADSTSVAMEIMRIRVELEERVRTRTAELERALEENHRLATTDELTGLSNRRGFYLLAEPALLEALRRGDGCELAYLDVDRLKAVNDDHGHGVGDSLIVDVANVLRGWLHPSDLVGRVGGDEFCVLVTAGSDHFAGLKDKLAQAFSEFNAVGGRPYELSVSIGVVQWQVTDGGGVDELLARADELMYANKKARLQLNAGAPVRPCNCTPTSGGDRY